MPQADDIMHSKMERMFGDPIGDEGPITFLEKAGYRLTRQFTWVPKEGVVTADDMTQEEYDCMRFLIDEWDYGWLEKVKAE